VIRVPSDLRGRLAFEDVRSDGAGGRWLASLPHVLARLAVAWELTLGTPIAPGGMTSVVVPARRGTGELAVLKVPVPEEEQAGEAAGLALVDGEGAVRLLGHDAVSGAMLLERSEADRSLLTLDDPEAAVATAASLLRRWWRSSEGASGDASSAPAAPLLGDPVDLGSIPSLASLAPGFAASLEHRADRLRAQVGPTLLRTAIATLREVPSDGDVLLHTDLHLGNALAAEREPWLVIDPKPAWGPAGYDVQPLLRDGLPPPGPELASAARRRFDRLTESLGVDRQLARRWTVARCIELSGWAIVDADMPSMAARDLAVAAALLD
jgi:streptomycin 6-kinase